MAKRRQEPKIPKQGRVLGVDLGEVRLGCALTDPGQIIASPGEILQLTSEADDDELVDAIVGAAREHEVVGVVVGLPRRLDGREGRAAARARRIATAVGESGGLPVHLIDERFSSVEAERMMADAGLDSRQRRGRVDGVAASIILRAWLDGRR